MTLSFFSAFVFSAIVFGAMSKYFSAIVKLDFNALVSALRPNSVYLCYSLTVWFIITTCVEENLLLDDSTTKDFHPVALIHYFKFPRRMGEREEAVYPSVLNICQENKIKVNFTRPIQTFWTKIVRFSNPKSPKSISIIVIFLSDSEKTNFYLKVKKDCLAKSMVIV